MRDQLIHAIVEMEEEQSIRLVREMLEAGEDPQGILDAGREAMAMIGQRYEEQKYYLPELMIGGDILREMAEIVKPHIQAQTGNQAPIGKVVIGTVAGDIHDIGKDIVAFMLDVNNFEVYNLGVDVPAEVFVEKIKEVQPQVVGLSGFLTLVFDQMKATIQAIDEAGLRDQVKIMIGGSAMDDAVIKYIGADAYGKDAGAAVRLAKEWVG
jgi:methanogenic corrinoid protein MtbC1